MEACDVCGMLEKRTEKKLVSVCDCYKKYEDQGRMHEECLKEYLMQLSARNEDAVAHFCPICGEQYRVRISYKFVCDWAHFCTARSLNNMFELIVVFFTMLCCASCFLILDFDVRTRRCVVGCACVRTRRGR